jgi:hypothetical protein
LADREGVDEYSPEINETPAFWELTRRAHKDAVILRLGRLYDPHATATSLGNLLQTMKENISCPGEVVPASIADLDAAELGSEIAAGRRPDRREIAADTNRVSRTSSNWDTGSSFGVITRRMSFTGYFRWCAQDAVQGHLCFKARVRPATKLHEATLPQP